MISESKRIERDIMDLFVQLPAHMRGRYSSVQFMRDDDFEHRRDRVSNDIHAFFESRTGAQFHLRAYVKHMLGNLDSVNNGMVFLTGYRKPAVKLHGGTHSLRQGWYANNPSIISKEILNQNPDFFLL